MSKKETTVRWLNNGLPRKGWSISSYHLDEEGDHCEWCNTEIYNVFVLTHENEPDAHIAGCVCTESLTEDYTRPREMEKEMRKKRYAKLSKEKRRQKFIQEKNKFYRSHKNNWVRKVRGRGKLTIFVSKNGQWAWAFENKFSQKTFPKSDAAIEDVSRIIFE